MSNKLVRINSASNKNSDYGFENCDWQRVSAILEWAYVLMGPTVNTPLWYACMCVYCIRIYLCLCLHFKLN